MTSPPSNATTDQLSPAIPQLVQRESARLAVVAWAALLVLGVPLFLCAPLISDVVLYDLQARTVLDGGVAYRDIFETNLPGMIWIHMLVRPLIGDSSIAIRCVDLAVVGSVIAFAFYWLRRLGVDLRGRVLFGFTMTLFYLSTNEWCHCQRDTWMLIPCLAAMAVRLRGMQEHPRRFGWSVAEGALWAAAFWIKPFTAVPGLFCIAGSWVLGKPPRRTIIREACGVLFGGAIVGLAGSLWLVGTGAWPHFWETMTVWNPEYFAAGKSRWTTERLSSMLVRFRPWMWLHAVAFPAAIALFLKSARTSGDSAANRIRAMFAVLYLGWLTQSFGLQHLMDYVHVPALMLGMIVIASSRWSLPPTIQRSSLVAFLVLASLTSPLLTRQRLSAWDDCVMRGSEPDVRMSLTYAKFPDFNHMERVIEFLNGQNLKDGEVTCYNVHSIHIYDRLRIEPSTRYLSLSSLLNLFPKQQSTIVATLARSPQRFVVTELGESKVESTRRSIGMTDEAFPWNCPVVFEAGTYRVHKVRGSSVQDVVRR